MKWGSGSLQQALKEGGNGKALSSDLPWLKPRYTLEVEPEALPHLSFLSFVLLPVAVGPEHPACKINSNCLSAEQQYLQKLIPLVPVGETCRSEPSHGLCPGLAEQRAPEREARRARFGV